MNLLVVILIQASFYALLGMGYVLIYRATRVLNLAHGDLMVFGAYLFFEALAASGGNLPLAILLAVTGAAVLGALIYLGDHAAAGGLSGRCRRAGDHRARPRAPDHRDVIWSAQTRYPAEYLGQFGRPVELLPGFSISGIDIAIIAAAFVAMVGFPFLLRVAAIGIEMRGVAENAVLAAQRGINIHRINALSWAAATIMAAIAGIFFSIKARLGPDIWYVGLAGFAPALIGGMDSLKGVAIGAVIVADGRSPRARSISRRRSRLPRRSWCFWSRCGSGRGVSIGSREELERI